MITEWLNCQANNSSLVFKMINGWEHDSSGIASTRLCIQTPFQKKKKKRSMTSRRILITR
jgi:hypothetical protein